MGNNLEVLLDCPFMFELNKNGVLQCYCIDPTLECPYKLLDLDNEKELCFMNRGILMSDSNYHSKKNVN